MELCNYICWVPSEVHQVIKIDAEAVGDKVFRAVHSPQPILMSTISANHLKPSADQDFLKAFINPDIPEIFSLVLGDSGAGKTHFIHWLRLNVPADEKRTRVVNIPKVGTSLRSIVEKIIDQLPYEMQAQYRNKLTTVGVETHTQEQLQEKLLDSLAQAVRAEADRGIEQDMERKEMLKGLAPLFRDPHIRSQWFLANERESIIKELTRHVYEPNKEYNRLEHDRQFKAADFKIENVRHANASLEARNMLDFYLKLPRYRDMAAELANQCLDAAIGEALSFSGEDLVALVAEVRKQLHEQGMSLIIYIEDLSRMQGVDKALLDALTTPSDQGDQKLCTIRWAAAMTTGYFDRLEATIGTRINLMGKVEATPEIWESKEAPGRLAMFMGRYLNAVRLGMDELNAWDIDQPLPNACDRCNYRDYCHDAFGMSDDFGMYPFTTEGLWNMAVRSSRDNENWFNPRRLLRGIVTPILTTYALDIVEGRFPSSAMIDEMGGERLDPLEKMELFQKAGADAGRHLTLQELWQPSTKIVPLHENLLAAFSLRQLRGKKHVEATTVQALPAKFTITTGVETRVNAQPADVETRTSSPTSKEVADPILDKLRDWGNRQKMDDQVAQNIRGFVFESIVNHIDWDRAGVAKTTYVGQGKPFMQTSIVFREQVTQSRAHLQLIIPLQGDDISFSRAATALQGLYLFSKNGHWDFTDGHRYLVYAQNCLEEWADAALELVKEVAPNDERWNAITAATELLAVGAALSGNVTIDSAQDDIWSVIWGDAPVNPSARLLSNEMQRVAKDIYDKWADLQKHVNARSFGTKGSRMTNFLNPSEREPVLVRLLKNNWRLSMAPDPDVSMHSDFKTIATLYAKVSQTLRPALVAEAEQYRVWLQEMDAHFGTDMASRNNIIRVFSELQHALNDGAILKKESDRFQQSLDAFNSAAYSDARKRAMLVVGTNSDNLGPHMFAKHKVPDAMHKARSLAEATEQYLNDITAYHENRMDELKTVAGEGLQACWDRIDETLQTLGDTLARLAQDDEFGRREA